MRIPCGDGVISRGSKANRGRSGKERNHTIIVKRDLKENGETKKKETHLLLNELGLKVAMKPMGDNRPPHGLASASLAPSGGKAAGPPFGYLQVAP